MKPIFTVLWLAAVMLGASTGDEYPGSLFTSKDEERHWREVRLKERYEETWEYLNRVQSMIEDAQLGNGAAMYELAVYLRKNSHFDAVWMRQAAMHGHQASTTELVHHYLHRHTGYNHDLKMAEEFQIEVAYSWHLTSVGLGYIGPNAGLSCSNPCGEQHNSAWFESKLNSFRVLRAQKAAQANIRKICKGAENPPPACENH